MSLYQGDRTSLLPNVERPPPPPQQMFRPSVAKAAAAPPLWPHGPEEATRILQGMRGSMARRGLAWRGPGRRVPPKPKPKPKPPQERLRCEARLWGHRAGVCLKGRALWGQTQSTYKAVGAHCKIGWGGSHWRLEKRGGGIGVVDVPSGRVEGGALGGEGGCPPPLKQSPWGTCGAA